MTLIGRKYIFFSLISIVLRKKARIYFHNPCSFISPKFHLTILVSLSSLFLFSFYFNYCFVIVFPSQFFFFFLSMLIASIKQNVLMGSRHQQVTYLLRLWARWISYPFSKITLYWYSLLKGCLLIKSSQASAENSSEEFFSEEYHAIAFLIKGNNWGG